MTIGVYTIEIHLPGARSLKDKRQVIKKLKDRLRSRHNVAVSELEEYAGKWQRSGLMIVSVAGRRDPLENLFEKIHRESESLVPGNIIETGREFIEGSDGGVSGWEEF